MCGGHVHLQYLRRLADTRFVNPGSVGLSYDHEQDPDDFRFDAFAAYAVLTSHGGRHDVTFRRVPFDRETLIASIAASGIPSSRELIRQWSARSPAG
jgi:diadenosine tetraphosphatase ApaH/serine/threonine PP2A family protein phosphatase